MQKFSSLEEFRVEAHLSRTAGENQVQRGTKGRFHHKNVHSQLTSAASNPGQHSHRSSDTTAAAVKTITGVLSANVCSHFSRCCTERVLTQVYDFSLLSVFTIGRILEY